MPWLVIASAASGIAACVYLFALLVTYAPNDVVEMEPRQAKQSPEERQAILHALSGLFMGPIGGPSFNPPPPPLPQFPPFPGTAGFFPPPQQTVPRQHWQPGVPGNLLP